MRGKIAQWGYITKPQSPVLHIADDGDTVCGLPGIAMYRYQFADHKPVCANCLRRRKKAREGVR